MKWYDEYAKLLLGYLIDNEQVEILSIVLKILTKHMDNPGAIVTHTPTLVWHALGHPNGLSLVKFFCEYCGFENVKAQILGQDNGTHFLTLACYRQDLEINQIFV